MKNDNDYIQTGAASDPNKTPNQTHCPDWNRTDAPDSIALRSKMEDFIQLRASGLSLGRISRKIGVPKSTLYSWNIRNRQMLAWLRRIEFEALEERLLGTRQQQIIALARTLKRLNKSFIRKLADSEDDLSLTEVFWMSANLRFQLQRLRNDAALTDHPEPSPHPHGDVV
jgi:hypothetical protein